MHPRTLWLLSIGCALAAVACDSTTPAPTRTYSLETIGDQPLPAIVAAGGGDTVIVLDETLTLFGTGRARAISHIRHTYLTYPSEERTITTGSEYRIRGDSIEVGFFGRCLDLCPNRSFGLVTDSLITLTAEIMPPGPISRYRLSHKD